ncbi:MAG: hypothetical protein FJ264_18330 [Planctomycetes bacterium]|nr:hypothetical protein [Planctomycetota bacterium]
MLDAETRIGDLLKAIPKASPGVKPIMYPQGHIIHKEQKAAELGFNRKQVSQFQRLAEHKEIVEEVKAEAKENDDLPTRTEVLRKIKERDKQERLVSEKEFRGYCRR